MKRREFLTAASVIGASAAGMEAIQAAEEEPRPRWNRGNRERDPRRWVMIRRLQAPDAETCSRLAQGLDATAVKNIKPFGIERVGLFTVRCDLHEGDQSLPDAWRRSVVMVLEARSIRDLLMLQDNLLEKINDEDRPEFTRDFSQLEEMQVSLHRTFPKCHTVEVPYSNPERLLQLRCYFSPSLNRNRMKREMFDTYGELDIFRRCNMLPVFFTETIFGTMAPNITYMLSFENNDARVANWDKFVNHPDWQKLHSDPMFANTATKILNVFLQPLSSSEI